LLALLFAGLFSVPVFIVINKEATVPAAGSSLSQDSVQDVTSRAPSGTVQANAQKEVTVVQAPVQTKSQTTSAQTISALPGEWVILDCKERVVLHCPHTIPASGQTPEYPATQTSAVYRGRCRDVSIQITSFCDDN